MNKFAILLISIFAILFVQNIDAQIDARMLQYPAVSKTQIVFSYGDDLWLVSKDGGVAHHLLPPNSPLVKKDRS